jgi:hypothetical protein
MNIRLITTKQLFLFLFAITCLIVIDGCKKGDKDPALSFRSRKARVVGFWTIADLKGTSNVRSFGVSGNITYTTYTRASIFLDGVTRVETGSATTIFNDANTVNDVDSFTNKSVYKLTIQFNKDGTYELKEHLSDNTGLFENNLTNTGNWNFTSGIGELKNKEQIVLTPTKIDNVDLNTQTTHVYQTNRVDGTFNIIELKNKEMILQSHEQDFNAIDGSYNRYDYTYTFKQ